MLRLLQLAMACAMVLLAQARPAQAQMAQTVALYDPDANYEAIPRIVKGLNTYFAQALPGFTVKVTPDPAGLQEAIKGQKLAYAIVAAEYLATAAGAGLVPLLVPEAGGSVYYNKLLVDKGEGVAGDLRGKRVAAATGDKRAGASQKIFALLRSAGLQVDGAIFVGTSKDLDALLALTFNQAEAALVTSVSLDTLKTVNPGAASSLRKIWTSGKILRPVLVAVKANEEAAQRDKVVQAFNQLASSPAGKGAMQALGYDRWIAYTAEQAAGGGKP